MNRLVCILLGVALLSPVALAQNQTSPEQLQKMYDNTLELLRNAQDRKNELAVENQNLQKKLADLELLLNQKTNQMELINGQIFALQQVETRWRQFLSANPEVKQMWRWFSDKSLTPDRLIDLLGDGNWPFGLEDDAD